MTPQKTTRCDKHDTSAMYSLANLTSQQDDSLQHKISERIDCLNHSVHARGQRAEIRNFSNIFGPIQYKMKIRSLRL